MAEMEKCEVCGFRSYIKAIKGKYVLMFCMHHGRENAPALENKGWEIEDNTHVLYKDGKKPVIDESPLEVNNRNDGGGSGVLSKAGN